MNDHLRPRQLRKATRSLILAHRTLDRAKRPCGTPLSMPHAYTLITLLQTGPMTVSSLAAQLNIDRTNVSRLCARMEENGELVRNKHPQDKRARSLQLTPHGEQLARRVDASSVAYFEHLLTLLGTDADPIIEAVQRLADTMALTSKGI